MSYSSGILEDITNEVTNHAVILVGYTPKYWIIKNSWGDRAGMKGFYHIKMGNHAGICADGVIVATPDP